mmetsp:Transcript_25429/g.55205  ORF Transcript_25429/g.55205 Transcript_25429/m.55205 type:complete len:163 (+) Transcript_25429:99-587(+)|eukprot:CAMPEP_0202893288 /NCGR_PEP_ID=MMETSP1392-20130828/2893_1 /ASSEMBLY_ACC=CAM_ASM_000868 /TAXON_ID=225041 /ORGANISM="Chlamydomonas chlamydogama, Strain SAG 11-48b" /LENGTH=162 /DNA_ID=CAMNT_0049577569 /DNA_START=81 /DNA_END=569 /DNA_ORIENTATION=-
MPRKTVIALVGPDTDKKALPLATDLGRMIAEAGWVLLTGGRSRGVMDAAAKGAKSAGGLTIGVLPTTDMTEASEAIDIPVLTGMGGGRDNINALSCDVMIAVGMGAGTAAEVALALKAGKHVVLVEAGDDATKFFTSLKPQLVHVASDAVSALSHIKSVMQA